MALDHRAHQRHGRAVLKVGDKGPAVRALQEALHDMGFPMLELRGGVGQSGVDGMFGPQTRAGLQVALEGDGSSLLGQLDGDVELPRTMTRHVGAATGIVVFEA